MSKDAQHESGSIDYPAFIDEAMRGVVRRALRQVAESGLPDQHHFYISFATGYPGVRVSPQILDRYPEEMTIVLQYQFWDLEVYDSYFSVTLSFNNIPEKLVIPYNALTAFADPSIRFGLQFHTQPKHRERLFSREDMLLETDGKTETSFESPLPRADNEEGAEASSAEVISLDAFRKK